MITLTYCVNRAYPIITIQVLLSLFSPNTCHSWFPDFKIPQKQRTQNYTTLELKERTAGGDSVPLYEYTFMAVFVRYSTRTRRRAYEEYSDARKSAEQGQGHLVCGGAIIHKDWVLTSAKCFIKGKNRMNMDLYEIYAGVVDLSNEVGQQVRTIKNLLIHPQYKEPSDGFNIAMVEVFAPFQFTTYVSAGFLPISPLSISGTELCYILGFVTEYDSQIRDEIYTERLIKVKLHAIDYKECSERLRILKSEDRFRVSPTNYCVVQIAEYPYNNSQGACEGDVGGPCICGFKIQGIIASYSNQTCFVPGCPTAITDVGHHLNWVRKNIVHLNVLPRSCATNRINIKFIIFFLCFKFLLIKVIS